LITVILLREILCADKESKGSDYWTEYEAVANEPVQHDYDSGSMGQNLS